MPFTDFFGLVGKTIERRYSIDSLVGEGGFGVVYRAKNNFGEHVAIKCLKLIGDPQSEVVQKQREAFKQEGYVLRKLSKLHPAILEVLDVGSFEHQMYGEVPYLVLEWLEGVPLSDIISARKFLNEVDVINLMRPIIEAISCAHNSVEGKIIVHRDLKPENIFVMSDDTTTSLKILDFGIAKIFDNHENVTHRQTNTHQQFRAFSPQYGAPEQFLPKKFGGTGPWTDIYALGLIFSELMLGKRIYEENDYGELLLLVTDSNQRPTPRFLGATVSDKFENMCSQCVALNPQERFKDADEILNYIVENFKEINFKPTLKKSAKTSIGPMTAVKINTLAFDNIKNSTMGKRSTSQFVILAISIIFMVSFVAYRYADFIKQENSAQQQVESKTTTSKSSNILGSSQPSSNLSAPNVSGDSSNYPSPSALPTSSNTTPISSTVKPSSFKNKRPNVVDSQPHQPSDIPQPEQNTPVAPQPDDECTKSCKRKISMCKKACRDGDENIWTCASNCELDRCTINCLVGQLK